MTESEQPRELMTSNYQLFKWPTIRNFLIGELIPSRLWPLDRADVESCSIFFYLSLAVQHLAFKVTSGLPTIIKKSKEGRGGWRKYKESKARNIWRLVLIIPEATSFDDNRLQFPRESKGYPLTSSDKYLSPKVRQFNYYKRYIFRFRANLLTLIYLWLIHPPEKIEVI